MMEYIDDYRVFEGRLLDLESINQFPESLEKEHIKVVREWLKKEGFNPNSFRVGRYLVRVFTTLREQLKKLV